MGGLGSSVWADSYTLADGTVLTGEMIRFDDNAIMLREPGEVYTNVPWVLLSQDTLKQLAQNPKINAYIQPLLPPEPVRAVKPVLKLHEVVRFKLPGPTSVLGGLFSSSVGVMIGLMIYAANLYAGFEIAICRNRPPIMVVLFSGLLPIIAPIIFLLMPVYIEEEEDGLPLPENEPVAMPSVERAAGGAAPVAAGKKQETRQEKKRETDDSPPTTPTWSMEQPKKPEAQIFQRGKFMFNKRFIETKFATFVKGPSRESVLVIITPKGQFVANRIGEVMPAEMQIFCDNGEALILYADIHEMQIKPRDV